MEQAMSGSTAADDILREAREIAAFIFGDAGDANRKRIYQLAAKGQIPTFRLGQMLCARKSALLAHIAAQEARSMQSVDKPEAA
jgi:hypothetical protein